MRHLTRAIVPILTACARWAVLSAVLAIATPAICSATNISLGAWNYTQSGPTVVLKADAIKNNSLSETSGALRMELWAFRGPFTGSPQLGYQLAIYTLPQPLPAGYQYSNISSGTIPFSPPPPGLWDYSLLITEYTGTTFATDVYSNASAVVVCNSSGICGNGNMTYHGGAVQHFQKVYTIFWSGTGTSFPAGYQATINQFVQDLNGSSYYATANQYGDSFGKVSPSVAYAGTWLDTTNPTPSSLPTDLVNDAVLYQALTQEVLRATAANSWRIDEDSVFFVYTPSTLTNNSEYCGYHTAAPYGLSNHLAFGLIPFPSQNCMVYSAPWPNGQIVDHAINVTAHEIVEAATNPFGDGWYLIGSSEEIGDLCDFRAGPRDGTGADLQLNGHKYLVQMLWSNAVSGCAMTGTVLAKTYHVFPQVADGYNSDGSYFQSTLVVTTSNPSTGNPSCTVQFHGLAISGQSQASFTVVGGVFVFPTPGNTQALQTGYASLQCSSNVEAQLQYALHRPDGTKISEATVFSSPSATWLRMVADERGGAQLGLAVANDSSQSGNYTIRIYDNNGNLIGAPTLTVNPGSNRAFFLDQLTTIPSNNWGIVDIIASSGTASVIGLRFTGTLFTTIPATVMSSTSVSARTYHVFPQVADGYASDGSYFRSTLVVTNSDPAADPSCTLQFHGLAIGGQSQASFTVRTFSVFPTPGNTQALQTGYASLQCSSNVEAQLQYARYTPDGTKISEATVFSSSSASRLRIFADERRGTQLGVAVANDSSQNGNYTIMIYDNNGNLIGIPTLTVNPGSSRAFFLDQLTTLISTRNNWGFVDIIANSGSASVIGLSFNGTLFTTIPAAMTQ